MTFPNPDACKPDPKVNATPAALPQTVVGNTDDYVRKAMHAAQPSPLPEGIDAVLNARGKRYGLFTGHAAVTQKLKSDIAAALADREKVLADDQQEALDMICHKIGRIVNGDADYDDSWVDIAGYAQLVADRLRGKAR